LYEPDNYLLFASLNVALHAEVLFHRDIGDWKAIGKGGSGFQNHLLPSQGIQQQVPGSVNVSLPPMRFFKFSLSRREIVCFLSFNLRFMLPPLYFLIINFFKKESQNS